MDATRATRLLDDAEQAILATRRSVLGDGLADSAATGDSPVIDETADVVVVGELLTEEAIDRSIVAELDVQLDAINAARARVAEETFGLCANCGERIPDERLEAVPWTRYCRTHQP